jgi:hypothetical protein
MTVGELIRKVSPPLGYEPDRSTSGPWELPEGWNCDAWQAEDDGRGYFLRAWYDETGEVATVQSETSYQEAADMLRKKVKAGGEWKVMAEKKGRE